ncbi:hypothetical protein Pcinc_027672 [Petrolisthes cinctipes]|uniref:Uncharacterized protein n=1 Tax=Petrolisthes cinctipes TaxID=88211 RepID=A0AAE1F4M1_PETCI|nr:hypothetical protein Pcinc_027672 [Petrolisthes cinctipes]
MERRDSSTHLRQRENNNNDNNNDGGGGGVMTRLDESQIIKSNANTYSQKQEDEISITEREGEMEESDPPIQTRRLSKVNRWTKIKKRKRTKKKLRPPPKSPGTKIEEKLDNIEKENYDY